MPGSSASYPTRFLRCGEFGSRSGHVGDRLSNRIVDVRSEGNASVIEEYEFSLDTLDTLG
jgi:hypothetical protein